MTPSQLLIVAIPIAYLIGSIPFGLVVAKRRGVDPRLSGSGNIGATNVGRLLGKKFFFIVFFLDMLKSLGPMLFASGIVSQIPESQRDRTIYTLWIVIGLAAVLGHMFSAFLKFKGGKGVATSAGVMLGLVPYFLLPGLIAVGVFIVVFYLFRYISLGSILGACAFPLAYLGVGLARQWPVTGNQLPLLLFAVLLAGLIVFRHRTNIQRLINGTENRFTRKPA